MRRVHSDEELRLYMSEAVKVSNHSPVLIDKFLQDAVELDVDAISDGKDVYIGAVMQHIEEAGIHSGDSACILPPLNLTAQMIKKVENQTRDIALNLGVVGLMNIQFAIYENKQSDGEADVSEGSEATGQNELFIIEVNPRASRTVPFVSKATGVPMAKVATRVMWQGDLREALKFYDNYGAVYEERGILKPRVKNHVCVKEAVFPFNKLSGADLILGPEMKSTGEVMGISEGFAKSFAKSQIAASNSLPTSGLVFLTLADADKKYAANLARELINLGFKIIATGGTYKILNDAGVESEFVYKISEGRPNVEDRLKNGDIALVINTSDSKSNSEDGKKIRQNIMRFKIPYFTTMSAALAAAKSLKSVQDGSALEVKSLQEYLGGK